MTDGAQLRPTTHYCSLLPLQMTPKLMTPKLLIKLLVMNGVVVIIRDTVTGAPPRGSACILTRAADLAQRAMNGVLLLLNGVYTTFHFLKYSTTAVVEACRPVSRAPHPTTGRQINRKQLAQ